MIRWHFGVEEWSTHKKYHHSNERVLASDAVLLNFQLEPVKNANAVAIRSRSMRQQARDTSITISPHCVGRHDSCINYITAKVLVVLVICRSAGACIVSESLPQLVIRLAMVCTRSLMREFTHKTMYPYRRLRGDILRMTLEIIVTVSGSGSNMR